MSMVFCGIAREQNTTTLTRKLVAYFMALCFVSDTMCSVAGIVFCA